MTENIVFPELFVIKIVKKVEEISWECKSGTVPTRSGARFAFADSRPRPPKKF